MIARLLALFLSVLGLAAPAAAQTAQGEAGAGQTIVIHAGRLIADASQRPRGPSTITVVGAASRASPRGTSPRRPARASSTFRTAPSSLA